MLDGDHLWHNHCFDDNIWVFVQFVGDFCHNSDKFYEYGVSVPKHENGKGIKFKCKCQQKSVQFHAQQNGANLINSRWAGASDRVIVEVQTARVYPLIRAADPCWPVVIYGIIAALVTLCGILSNLSVLFVTIRTKTFRGTANILLALYSFCEIVHLSGNFLSIFTAFSGNYFMRLDRAFYFLIVPSVSIGCAINLMLFIGIERLFVVLFPLKKFRPKLFFAIVFTFTLISIISTIIVFGNCFFSRGSTEILANFYEIGGLIEDQCASISAGMASLITVLITTVIIYASIAIVLHCRKASSNANNSTQFNNRIFRSLLAIVFVNVGGYLFAVAAFFFIQPIASKNVFIIWHFNKIVGILMHISASSNGPILYWTSSDYRVAFQRNFAFLFNLLLCFKSPTITPQN